LEIAMTEVEPTGQLIAAHPPTETTDAVGTTNHAAPVSADVNLAIEIRKVKTADGEQEFPFVTVDSAEKWLAAEQILCRAKVGLAGSTPKAVKLKGISYAFWEGIEQAHPLPEMPKDANGREVNSPEYQDNRNREVTIRKIKLIEYSTGLTIPGDDIAAKIEWYESRAMAEMGQLFVAVENIAAGFGSGNTVDMYEMACQHSVSAALLTTIDSLELWDQASSTTAMFRMQRLGQDFILEFPLKAINTQVKRMLDETCKRPEAPKIHLRNPQTQRYDYNLSEPNLKDPGWLEKVRAVDQREKLLLLSNTLLFKIPGVNEKEQYDWISQRMVGDVLKLEEFIRNEILGYKSRVNFF
jgi:hypothetical protein